MADNSTQGGADVIATDDLTTLNGGAVSGFKVQRVKVGWGVDATQTDVTATTPLPVTGSVSLSGSTGTVSTVNTNATINTASTSLAADATRDGLIIKNNGTASVNIVFGTAVTITTTLFTLTLLPGQVYEVPAQFAGLAVQTMSATASVPLIFNTAT